MIDFSTLQGLTIPEGVVTQIADAAGNVLWAAQSGGKVILEVEKITATTYAGETQYADEQFILLDIYPKTNGTVKVTYGGLTKTITDTSGAEDPNAQQVFFGTFNGVSDSVETPASGRLTIKGDYRGAGVGAYSNASGKSNNVYCSCITAIGDWGNVEILPPNAFRNCRGLTGDVAIPEGVTTIDPYAFYYCIGLTSVDLPEGLETIRQYAFGNCSGLTSVTIPASVTNMPGTYIFGSCSALTDVVVLATTPPAFGNTIDTALSSHWFDSCPLVSITVPAGCGEAYRAAPGWAQYADYIVEAS